MASACGPMDEVVEYFKLVRSAVWMSADGYLEFAGVDHGALHVVLDHAPGLRKCAK